MPQDLDPHFRYRFLCVGFRNVNNVAAGFDSFNEAEIASGGCDLPLAWGLLGLRFTTLVRASGRVYDPP